MRSPASAVLGPAEPRCCETPLDDHLVRANARVPGRTRLGAYCVCFVKMAEIVSYAEEHMELDDGDSGSGGAGMISPLRDLP